MNGAGQATARSQGEPRPRGGSLGSTNCPSTPANSPRICLESRLELAIGLVTSAAVIDGRQLALELYELLRGIDRAGWRDASTMARERLTRIEERAGELYHHCAGGLRDRFGELATSLREHAPDPEAGREAWLAFRARVVPSYEALAAALAREAAPVPSLRPKNSTRSLFHVATALSVIVLIEEVLTKTGLIVAPAVFAGTFWFLEILRRVHPPANDALMWLFSKVAHPHEKHRVNSSTWYGTALLLIAFIQEPLVCTVAVAVLGIGDPAAGLVGRRFGRTPLINGRTLEGSLTFVACGTLAALAALLVWHGGAPIGLLLLVAFGSALFGAVAELSSNRLDDNFTVPVAAAAGAWVLAASFGVLS